MYYELALIAVLIGGGYWGWQFVRQEALRLYGALNIAAAALAGVGFVGQRQGESSFGVPGAIGAGAGACLLVLGPLARGLARRAAASDRFTLAQRLLDVAEILAPGSGVGDEKALVAALREIRDGKIEKPVAALAAAKHGAPPETRLAIDERIAMLYLAAYRWDEAIAYAEEHLFSAAAPESDVGNDVALRRVLGLSPPVWVELLGAYGYKGELDRAAQMIARLEDVCSGRPDGGIWLHRGRLIFLALAGRVAAVQALLEPKRSRHMKPGARTYWLGVAHERNGEVAAAETAYTTARSRSRGRPRVLIEQALSRVANAKPVELGAMATDVVARVEAQPPPSLADALRPRRAWAVRAIVATMVASAAAISFGVGQSTDVGVLLRDGALVTSLVDTGEWWRLVSCTFVHVGGLHLLNVVALWIVGRFVEELFGGSRTFAVFGLSAVAGSVASYLAGDASIAAGASGGLLGLLGALIAEVTVLRRRQRAGWPRGLWGSLVLVGVAQVALGFLYPIVDQWAHGAALGIGLVLGFVLSPQHRIQRATLQIARVISIAFAGTVVFAAVMVVQTPVSASLQRGGLEHRDATTYSAVVPATWEREGDELLWRDVYIALLAGRAAGPRTVAEQLADFTTGEKARAKAKRFDQVADAADATVPLPAGWQGSELAISFADPFETRQRYRVIVAARKDADGDGVVLASIYAPESVVRAAPQFFTNLLASIRAR